MHGASSIVRLAPDSRAEGSKAFLEVILVPIRFLCAGMRRCVQGMAATVVLMTLITGAGITGAGGTSG